MPSQASLQKTITDQIIAALENNLVPWKSPLAFSEELWTTDFGIDWSCHTAA